MRWLEFSRVVWCNYNCVYYLPLFCVNSEVIEKIYKPTTSASYGPVLQTVKKNFIILTEILCKKLMYFIALLYLHMLQWCWVTSWGWAGQIDTYQSYDKFCANNIILDAPSNRSETPGKFRNVVLEKDGEDQLDRSCEKWRSVT